MKRADLVVTSKGAWIDGSFLPCSIGRNGLTRFKREGDGATPASLMQVTGCLYRPDRLVRPAPWARPIRTGDLWCDDPSHPAYNHLIRRPTRARHEVLFRADPLYDIVLTTDWNWPHAESGRGSAIFLHQWRKPRHPTDGCVAFAREVIRMLAASMPPGSLIDVRA